MTFVDRDTRCVVNWAVCWELNGDLVDQVPAPRRHGRWCYPDADQIYEGRGYHLGHHTGLQDKS